MLHLAPLCAAKKVTETAGIIEAPEALEAIEDIRQKLSQLPDDAPYVEYGRWFLSDQDTRPIAPGFKISARQADEITSAGSVKERAFGETHCPRGGIGKSVEAKSDGRRNIDLDKPVDGALVPSSAANRATHGCAGGSIHEKKNERGVRFSVDDRQSGVDVGDGITFRELLGSDTYRTRHQIKPRHELFQSRHK